MNAILIVGLLTHHNAMNIVLLVQQQLSSLKGVYYFYKICICAIVQFYNTKDSTDCHHFCVGRFSYDIWIYEFVISCKSSSLWMIDTNINGTYL